MAKTQTQTAVETAASFMGRALPEVKKNVESFTVAGYVKASLTQLAEPSDAVDFTLGEDQLLKTIGTARVQASKAAKALGITVKTTRLDENTARVIRVS